MLGESTRSVGKCAFVHASRHELTCSWGGADGSPDETTRLHEPARVSCVERDGGRSRDTRSMRADGDWSWGERSQRRFMDLMPVLAVITPIRTYAMTKRLRGLLVNPTGVNG